MHELVERENEIMGMLEKFAENAPDFVVVGGYAVSAFRHRFSVDADIVIREGDTEIFGRMLSENGYRKTASFEMRNIHSSRFVRYEKEELNVSMDLFIDGLGVRQTGAAFGFDFLLENSGKGS